VTLLKAAGPVPGQTVFSPHVAQEVRAMLQLAAQEGGTGQRAQTTGYSVAGKTGTARKVVGGQYLSKYRAFFVGVAPAHAPRVVVAVMIDEPGDGKIYGGQVAAPVFSELAQQTLRVLGVTPDATDNRPTTTTLTPVATAGGAA
jgi:cell division protein FtsI (penicillin-binding protein 3)